MKLKLVAESLEESMESSKAKTVVQDKKSKYEESIKALEAQLKKAEKPGEGSLIEKKAKIKDLKEKIEAFKKKIKNL